MRKSTAIIIENGKLNGDDLVLDDGNIICALKASDSIKYLGVTFSDEIVLNDNKIITNLTEKLNMLVSTPMLQPDQKIILNQYIWPIFTYSLQTTPLKKLTLEFLNKIDKIIPSSVKEIVSLPHDVNNFMIYSSKKVKELQITCARWEAFLQTFNIANILEFVDNPYVSSCRNLKNEKDICIQHLGLSSNDMQEILNKYKLRKSMFKKRITKDMRDELRSREFIKWTKLPQKGKGVSLFSQCPSANFWIYKKDNLSYSEWTSSIKMTANVAAARAIPGRSQNNHCRINSCNEIETLDHILGICPHGSLLRNLRHHEVRRLIAESLRDKGYVVHEEVRCVSEDDSNRRIDMIAISGRNGFIIDPTIQFESHDNQPEEVNILKKKIYDPCSPYLKSKYNIIQIETIGLMIGARGTLMNSLRTSEKDFPYLMI